MLRGILTTFCLAMTVTAAGATESLKTDVLTTSSGNLEITFVGHGSLMLTYGGRVIHVDPYSILADYTRLPKADLILVTHEHRDHLDAEAIRAVRQKGTRLIYTETCAGQLPGGEVVKNGDTTMFDGVRIEAVPAYNLVHKRDNGQPYHPRGVGNGYVLTFDNLRVYIAGDTENIPEMQALKGVDVAFLPMNLPVDRMRPIPAAECVKTFRPKIVYLNHYDQAYARWLTDPTGRQPPDLQQTAATIETFREALRDEPTEFRDAAWYPPLTGASSPR